MKTISASTTRAQLAAIVVDKLQQHDIDAVLVGGSVVSIYTENKYESFDLDFISPASHQKISKVMSELGFSAKGKDFVHPATRYTVEFPSGPLGIGDDQPIEAEGQITVDGVQVRLLSPTQSVMDRLISFFIFNDRQCLDQAVWIAQSHPIALDKVKAWATRERYLEKLDVFLSRL